MLSSSPWTSCCLHPSPGRPWAHPLREILDGIFYVVRTGCQWHQWPHEFASWPTVSWWFRRFRLDGTWIHLNAALRELARRAGGRHPQPSAAILDSQSVKTTGVGGVRGYDGAKQLSGRKRHVLVETPGLLLTVTVPSAELQDRAAVPLVLAGAHERCPRSEHLWVDQGYTGTGKQWIEEHLGWRVEVVRHPPPPRGQWVPHGDMAGDLVHLGTSAAGSKGLPRHPAPPLGRGADLLLVRPEPSLEQGTTRSYVPPAKP